MDTDLMPAIDELVRSSTTSKVCSRCRRSFTDADNLRLPCLRHVGEPYHDLQRPGREFWSCCGTACAAGAADSPCCTAAHVAGDAGYGLPPLILLAYRTKADVEVAPLPSRGPRAMTVANMQDLGAAVSAFGTALAWHPSYHVVSRYLASSAAAAVGACRYGGSADDGEEEIPAAVNRSRRMAGGEEDELRFVLASSASQDSICESSVRYNVDKLAIEAPYICRVFMEEACTDVLRRTLASRLPRS